ncbi:uncharacterized protein LOC128216783 isoform X1 [Mya arenaria]|uniref:uncharacterized protein LOC128216783 isoform X1 n=1 Tax=Mya arenaria TaxID=6604 RepID=UPI0022E23448|nr:uncharacterized protein LOC128216783 isoform X1 [Mya arenaria]
MYSTEKKNFYPYTRCGTVLIVAAILVFFHAFETFPANMNSSLNPFLADGQLDQDNDMFNQSFMAPASSSTPFAPIRPVTYSPLTPMPNVLPQPSPNVLSQPMPNVLSQPSPQPGPTTVYLHTPAVQPISLSDRIIKKFAGYMHENASKFLSEFESYLMLSGIDPSIDSARAIAAFHLHLQGPALTWFNALPMKITWTSVKHDFSNEYCDVLNDPRLISETAAFDNLRLQSHQAIAEFHSIVLEKGSRLGKTERDMTNKILMGQNAIWVQASSLEGKIQSRVDRAPPPLI